MTKKIGFTLLRILVSIALLGFAIHRIRFESLIENLKTFNVLPFLAALVLFQVGLVQRTWRWSILLRGYDIGVPFRKLVNMNYVAVFFSTFLPTGFGGDVVRMVEIEQYAPDSQGHLAGLSVLDRILGLITTTTSALFFLPFVADKVPISFSVTLLLLGIGGCLILVLLLSNQSTHSLQKFLPRLPGGRIVLHALESVTKLENVTIWKALAVSASHTALIVVVNFLVGRASSETISLFTFAVTTPIVTTALLLPSIQGLGVREGGYAILLSLFGVPNSVGLLIGLGVYAQNLITGLLGGVWYFLRSFLVPLTDSVN